MTSVRSIGLHLADAQYFMMAGPHIPMLAAGALWLPLELEHSSVKWLATEPATRTHSLHAAVLADEKDAAPSYNSQHCTLISGSDRVQVIPHTDLKKAQLCLLLFISMYSLPY